MMTIRHAITASAWAGILIIASQFAWPHAAAAHGGGLNAQGCHNDRKNGGYHCHRSPAAPKPPAGNTPTPTANRPTGNQSGQVYYANCSAARAAGAAPVRRGDPGYGRHLDRDGDGVGCE